VTEPTTPQPNWTFAIATVLWALLVGLALRLLIISLAQFIGGASTLQWLDSSPLGLSVIAATIQSTLFLVVLWRASLCKPLRKRVITALMSRSPRAVASIALILGIGPLANLCGMWVSNLTHADLESMKQIGVLIRNATVVEFVALGLVLTLLPALVEESLFRGLVFESIRGKTVWFGLVLQALAFGAFHMDVAQGVATAILGLGFGYIVYSTGSLLGSMAAHATYNFVVLLSQRFLPQEEGPLYQQLGELFLGLAVAIVAALSLHRGRQNP
jgi:membrane protease YdiL (CAAX protease family)